jgi:hypothetical protein
MKQTMQPTYYLYFRFCKKTKTMTKIILLFCLITQITLAQNLSDAERQKAIDLLKSGLENVKTETQNLSQAQLNFKPNTNAWSIKDNVEHLGKTEDFLMGLIARILKNEKQEGQKNSVSDEQMIAAISKRSKGVQAPEPLVPSTNQHQTIDVLLDIFAQKRQHTINYAASTSDNLRGHFSKHPAFELADAYQWLLHLAAHTPRHLEQIVDIKNNPNFPKN